MEKSRWRKVVDTVLDIVFPKYCVTCGDEGEYLCQSCFGKAASSYYLFDKDIIAAGSYRNYYLKETIHYFKYRFIKELVVPLSKLVIRTLEQKFSGDYLKNRNIIIVPVPLHRKKFKQRGFNQAELIAKFVGNYFNLAVKPALQKTRLTKPQMSMKEKSERLKNLANVFVCSDKDLVAGKEIFLVDDVATTGATLNECARALKQAGAKKIWKIVVAK